MDPRKKLIDGIEEGISDGYDLFEIHIGMPGGWELITCGPENILPQCLDVFDNSIVV